MILAGCFRRVVGYDRPATVCEVVVLVHHGQRHPFQLILVTQPFGMRFQEGFGRDVVVSTRVVLGDAQGTAVVSDDVFSQGTVLLQKLSCEELEIASFLHAEVTHHILEFNEAAILVFCELWTVLFDDPMLKTPSVLREGGNRDMDSLWLEMKAFCMRGNRAVAPDDNGDID